MKIKSAEFIISAVGPKQYPEDGLPEIANKMMNRKALARTSQKPGKTQTLNYFRVNEMLYFVDFPGYGYAKVAKTLRHQWGKMIEGYLKNRKELKFIVQLIDLRHPPTKDDISMYEWCKELGLPTVIVTTKADKISRGRWQQHLKVIKQDLHLRETDTMILFSSETGQGRDELWKEILRRLGQLEEQEEMEAVAAVSEAEQQPTSE